nr:recombinase family protein [Kocuria sp. 36]
MAADFEADLLRIRTREGRAVAKENGRLQGDKPKFSPSQKKHLVSLHCGGGIRPKTSRNGSARPGPRCTEQFIGPVPVTRGLPEDNG